MAGANVATEQQPADRPGLAERLQNVPRNSTARNNDVNHLRLFAVRGATGTVHEGTLLAQSADDVACCFGSSKKKRFFVVKGPWMLQFRKDDEDAVATGLPIPLDGATVTPTGEMGFEFSNVHVKENFYGKEALQKVHKNSRKSFEHNVEWQFTAPSSESRDQWVQALQVQIKKICDMLASKLQNQKGGAPIAPRDITTETVAAVNGVCAALFTEYEEDVEQSAFKEEFALYSSPAALVAGNA